MQKDMHFYGTYAMARAAGIPSGDSKTIAYAAQFVDDSTKANSGQHADGGLLYGIATAHHAMDAAKNSIANPKEQRRVWVPFHFIPGGKGEEFMEKLICVKDSEIANEMINHHIEYAKNGASFGLELLGIGAHVYMDTFSHYGFSGVSDKHNSVGGNTIKFLTKFKKMSFVGEIWKKVTNFNNTYATKMPLFTKIEQIIAAGLSVDTISAIGNIAEALTGSLGHSGVATLPDRPYLHWKVTFDLPRSNGQRTSDRDNPATFLEGCEKLHGYFSDYAKAKKYGCNQVPFDKIEKEVSNILKFQGWVGERVENWRQAMEDRKLGFICPPAEFDAAKYVESAWENEKNNFPNLPSSDEGLKTHSYRFHQAAALHRYYILKDLLPKHGIAVY